MLASISKTLTYMWGVSKVKNDLPKDTTEPLIKKPNNPRKDENRDVDRRAKLSQVIYGI